MARSLDRETRSKYELTAHVQDQERTDWECLSQVIITVSDENDNVPVFVAPSGNATVLESAEIGTLVTKVHATDADVGEYTLRGARVRIPATIQNVIRFFLQG